MFSLYPEKKIGRCAPCVCVCVYKKIKSSLKWWQLLTTKTSVYAWLVAKAQPSSGHHHLTVYVESIMRPEKFRVIPTKKKAPKRKNWSSIKRKLHVLCFDHYQLVYLPCILQRPRPQEQKSGKPKRQKAKKAQEKLKQAQEERRVDTSLVSRTGPLLCVCVCVCVSVRVGGFFWTKKNFFARKMISVLWNMKQNQKVVWSDGKCLIQNKSVCVCAHAFLKEKK